MTEITRFDKGFVPFNPEIHHAATLNESGPRVYEMHKWIRANCKSYVDGQYVKTEHYKFWFTDEKEAAWFLLAWS
jgi:hypothetical protein